MGNEDGEGIGGGDGRGGNGYTRQRIRIYSRIIKM